MGLERTHFGATVILGSAMRPVTTSLRDGTPVLIRPLTTADAPAVQQALAELSPESRYRRFLMDIARFTPEQLRYLTQVDGIDHLALGMAVLTGDPPPKPISIARCIRDPAEPTLAEVAASVADAWQGRGAGALILRELAKWSWEQGIRRWNGTTLAENAPAQRLLEGIGTPRVRRSAGTGVLELEYELHSPPVLTPNPNP